MGTSLEIRVLKQCLTFMIFGAKWIESSARVGVTNNQFPVCKLASPQIDQLQV